MSSRTERGRALLEKSAAVLAADFAFDVLIEHLCTAIALEMHATASAAFPNDDGTVWLNYVTERGLRHETHEQLMPEDSAASRVLRTGRSILTEDAIHVPVTYGESVLGVLSVEHAENGMTREDLRVMEIVARHLAIATGHQRSLRTAPARVRYPWIATILVAFFVLGATTGIFAWMNNRIANDRAAAYASAHEEAQRAARLVDRSLSDDRELATIAAYVVGPVRATPQFAVSLVRRLLRAQPDGDVYRIGIFYEPGAFSGAARYGFFIQSGAPSRVHTSLTYATQPWYRRALAAHGRTAYTVVDDPAGEPYVSAAKAFLDGKRPAGVVTIDTLVSSLRAHLQDVTLPHSRLSLSGTDARNVVEVNRGGPSAGDDVDIPLARVRWTVHVAMSRAAVDTAVRRTMVAAAGAIALLWSLGAMLIVVIHLVHGMRRDALGLKRQRAHLQSEIAARLEREERLRTAAYHDNLTGLSNRAFFLRQLQDVLAQRRTGSGVEYAVLFIDLDRFYVVNDSMGHNVGDQLLHAIAYRLEETIPPHALISRLGGDEFVLLLPSEGPAIQEAIATAEDVLQALRNPFIIGEREVFSSASIGIVKLDDSYEDSETVLRDADISMYQAKHGGRARYAVFDRAMRDRVSQQIEVEGALRGAVERREIVAFYQPIVDVQSERITGFEALARWRRDGESTVAAGEFVPVAEQAGMMRAIDAELFAQVCRDVVELCAVAPAIRVSVNVSANDLTRASLLPDIDSTIERFAVAPESLRLEITETAVMEDAERALAMLEELRERRLEIIVDDFGAGYSSLSYLRRLPLAGVKIDRSFITALAHDAPALEIVRAIVALAKTLGLHTTAEGVETSEQLVLLRELGVNYAQGYLFSPAVDFETAKSFFAVRS